MAHTLENVNNNKIAIAARILGSMMQSCKSRSSESYEQFLMCTAQTIQLLNSQEAQ